MDAFRLLVRHIVIICYITHIVCLLALLLITIMRKDLYTETVGMVYFGSAILGLVVLFVGAGIIKLKENNDNIKW